MKYLSTLTMAALVGVAACSPLNRPSDDMTIIDASGPGQCKLSDWEAYVGKPRQSLPAVPRGLQFRMLCEGCMATMDFRADRVSFTYNDKDVITRVACG